MNNSILVYPHCGFLNTDFRIKGKQSTRYFVYYKGKECESGNIDEGDTVTLHCINQPGEYEIATSFNSEKMHIQVEDALRLGNGTLKQAYAFDKFPYVVFVMTDRIHFYDPTLQEYVFTENLLCPEKIQAIDEKKLLFLTNHSDGVSVSVFDIDSFSVIASLECQNIVSRANDGNWLYLQKEGNSDIICVSTNDLKEKCFYKTDENLVPSYWICDEENCLFVISENNIARIQLDGDSEARLISRKNAIGITQNGYVIYKDDPYGYSYYSFDTQIKHNFNYCPLYDEIVFDGFVIDGEFSGDNPKEIEKPELADAKTTFENECLSNPNKQMFIKEVNILKKSSARLMFHPMETGMYLFEDVNYDMVRNLICTIRNGETSVTERMACLHNCTLSWISNSGSKISYSYDRPSYDFRNALIFKDNKASLSDTAYSSFVLENGIMGQTFDTYEGAKEYLCGKTEKKDYIEINDESIPVTKILCQDSKKLIARKDTSYCYYEKTDDEWIAKTVNLAENGYTRAAISKDGNFIMYSKGRNQYALYNIKQKKEEKIFTGNFIDFDRSGNIIASDEYREIRIYDPVTFERKNNSPQYYTFVSPDGKLYAKTSLLTKYFSVIDEKELSKKEYFEFKKEFDHPCTRILSKKESEDYAERRNAFMDSNKDFFKKNIFSLNERMRVAKKIPEFTSLFIEEKQYVIIGIVGQEVETEIELNTHLDYLNYVSFSYDNKYVGIVGKPMSDGYLNLTELDFNEQNNFLAIRKTICDIRIADFATWTCSFTRSGIFGTYDSTPNFYMIPKDQYDFFKNDKTIDSELLRKKFKLCNRSLMCFSDSGKYVALSEQGYEAVCRGGRKHLPSNKMYIYSTEDLEKLDEWEYQGSVVSKLSPSDPYRKNLVQAGFSDDDRKIMTVTGDGVIVVRNLNLTSQPADHHLEVSTEGIVSKDTIFN